MSRGTRASARRVTVVPPVPVLSDRTSRYADFDKIRAQHLNDFFVVEFDHDHRFDVVSASAENETLAPHPSVTTSTFPLVYSFPFRVGVKLDAQCNGRMYPATLRAVEKSEELAEQQRQFLQQMWDLEHVKAKVNAKSQPKLSKTDAAARQGSALFDRDRRARPESPIELDEDTPEIAPEVSTGAMETARDKTSEHLSPPSVSNPGSSGTDVTKSPLKLRGQAIFMSAKSPDKTTLPDPKLPPKLPPKTRTIPDIDLAVFQFPYELGARDSKKQLLVENLAGPPVYIDIAYRELLIQRTASLLIGKFIRMLCTRLIIGPDDSNDSGVRALYKRREAILATCTPSEKKAGIGMSRILGQAFVTTVTCFITQNTKYSLAGDSVTRPMNSWKDDMFKRMHRRDGVAAENLDLDFG